MTEPLSQRVKISEAITEAAGAAGITNINGAILDMSGFEAVLVVVTFGAIVAGAVTSIRAQRDTDPAGGTMADLQGSNQVIADTDDGKTFYIDLLRPATKRYVRVVVNRATQNATVRSAFYIQYDPREKPTVQGALIAGERWVDPVEGTA